MLRYILVILWALFVISSFAHSQESPNSIAEWFRSLKTPNEVGGLPPGILCCDQSDCKQRTLRNNNGILEAFIEEANAWYPIPPESRITDPEILVNNPFFQAVVCFIPVRGVICYVPGNAGG